MLTKRLTIIELYGAPAAGKTFLANQLQAALTLAGVNSLYVHEFIKDHAVRKLPIKPEDQFWIGGSQFRIESAAYSNPPKYSVIVTDSPVSLAGFYAYQYGGQDHSLLNLSMLIRSWQNRVDALYQNERVRFRVPLDPVHFKPEGRFENNFSEAAEVDKTLSRWLDWIYPNKVSQIPLGFDSREWVSGVIHALK